MMHINHELITPEITDKLNQEFEEKKFDIDYEPSSIIAKMQVIVKELLNTEYKLMLKKHQYEVEYNRKCLSKEYEIRFKTVKAREQQAVLELSIMKKEIINLEMLYKIYKSEMELLRNELKYRDE